MLTTQKYAGKDYYVSNSAHTAQNDTQTPNLSDDRSANFTLKNSQKTPDQPAVDQSVITTVAGHYVDQLSAPKQSTDPDEVDPDDLDDSNEEDGDDEDLDTESALEAMCEEWTIPRWQYRDNQNFIEVLEQLATGMDAEPDTIVIALQDAFNYGMAFRHPATAHIELGITTDGETYQSDVELIKKALSSYQRNRFGTGSDRDLVYWIQIDGIINKINQEVVRDFATYGDTETQNGQGVPLPAIEPLRMIDPQARHYHPDFMMALQTMNLDKIAPAFTDKQAAEVLFDNLFDQGITSETDEGWTSITPVTTNGLFPQLGIGGYAVGVLLDPSDYFTQGGIVAIDVRSSGQTHFGRIGMGNSTSICLLADLPGFEPVRIARKDIKSIRRIVHAFGHSTL